MGETIHLFTIGFTKKSAQAFFGLLRDNHVKVLVDVRLKPDTQLAGFARKRDLPFFLSNLADCGYEHRLDMAPIEDLFKTYRANKNWPEYEAGFRQLLEERQLIQQLDRAWWAQNPACLLCSEHEPDTCHRRLVAEYMATHWPEMQITHLM